MRSSFRYLFSLLCRHTPSCDGKRADGGVCLYTKGLKCQAGTPDTTKTSSAGSSLNRYSFRYQLASVVVWIVAIVSVTHSEEPPELGIAHPISATVIHLATNENYDRALALVDSLTDQYPDHPYGHLLSATVLSARAVDFEDDLDDQAILSACDRVRELCLMSISDSSPDDPAQAVLLYYLGMADLFYGIVLQRQGSVYGSIRKVLRAGDYLEEAVVLDPTCWDVYYGLGMYKWYLSSRAGVLRSVGLVSDRREEGLRNIQTAIENGTLTRYAARNSLAWIAMENGDYDEAVERSRRSLEQFPDRRVFLWCLGKALVHSERWQEAIPVFTSLLESVRSESRNNHYNEVTCLYFLAQAYTDARDWSKVIESADEALNLLLSNKVKAQKKKELKQLRRMREDARQQVR